MKKHVIIIAFCLCALIALSACASSAPPSSPGVSAGLDGSGEPLVSEQVRTGSGKTLEAIKQTGVLKVGLESGFEPFEFTEGSELVGIDIDICNYIAEKWGVTVEFQDMNFDSALIATSQGVVDLGVSGITRNADRMQNMDFSDPYFTGYQVIVTKAGSQIKGVDDITGLQIGAQSGTTGETVAKDIVGAENEKNVHGYDRYLMAIQDLINGRIDCIIMDQLPAQRHVAANSDELAYLPEPIYEDNYCIAVQKDSPVVADLNAVIQEMKANGELQKIMDKYPSE